MGQGTSQLQNLNLDRLRSSNRDVQCLIAQRLTNWNDIQIALQTYPDLEHVIKSCIKNLYVNQDHSQDLKNDPMDFEDLPRSTKIETPSLIINRYYQPIIWDYSEFFNENMNLGQMKDENMDWQNLERTNIWVRVHNEEQLRKMAQLKNLKTIGIVLAGELDFDPIEKYIELGGEVSVDMAAYAGELLTNIVEASIDENIKDPFFVEIYKNELQKFYNIVNFFIQNLEQIRSGTLQNLKDSNLSQIHQRSPINLGIKDGNFDNLEDWDQYDKEYFNYIAIIPESSFRGHDNLYEIFDNSLGFFYDNLFGGRLRMNLPVLKSKIYNIITNNLPITTIELYGNTNTKYLDNFYNFIKENITIKRILLEINVGPGTNVVPFIIMNKNKHVDELWSSVVYLTERGLIFPALSFDKALRVASLSPATRVSQTVDLYGEIFSMDEFHPEISQIFSQIRSFNFAIFDEVVKNVTSMTTTFPLSQINIYADIYYTSLLTKESYIQIIKQLSIMATVNRNIHLFINGEEERFPLITDYD